MRGARLAAAPQRTLGVRASALLGTYAATLAVMVALDFLWLGVVAKPIYQRGIGHLMAAEPRLAIAVLFYLLFALGLVILAVLPNGASAGWGRTAGLAALFGFFAYATYDLTNLATLKDWPVGLSMLDMAWGSAVSAASACAGKAAWDYLSAA